MFVGIFALHLHITVIDTPQASAQTKNANGQEIGFVIATKGTVIITSKAAIPREATLRQEIHLEDTIRTGLNSSMKVLFDDSTMLSVSENTELTITEHIYNPSASKWSTILRMARGRIKAAVADIYDAAGSRFEIHTPTAVAAARGTDYVAWTFLQRGRLVTGVAVVAGRVGVSNPAGQKVTVASGFYVFASTDAPISTPALIATDPLIQQLVRESEVKTDPTVLPQVKIAQAQAPTPPSAPIVEVPIAERVPGEQWVTLGSGGISRSMGTTNTPCTFVTGTGFLPLGCTVPLTSPFAR
jgi:hypothetical protein